MTLRGRNKFGLKLKALETMRLVDKKGDKCRKG